jgi:hypothetical protein
MDIFVKAIIAAFLATIALIVGGQAMLKTNDLRNYPNLRPKDSPLSSQPGLADVDPNSAAARAKAKADGTGPMSEGQEAAAKSGFSTELANPNK